MENKRSRKCISCPKMIIEMSANVYNIWEIKFIKNYLKGQMSLKYAWGSEQSNNLHYIFIN